MKYISILFILFILCALTSCMFEEYRDTTEIMPGNADVVLNINIPSFFKRLAVLGELNKFQEDPDIKKIVKNLEELGLYMAFSDKEAKKIDLETELYPYLNINFTAGFYNPEKILINPEKKDEIYFITVLDIRDREGIDRFIEKINKNYTPQKTAYKNINILNSKKIYYFVNKNFLAFSNNMDCIKNSIDCIENNEKSMRKNNDFISFKEKAINDDSVGFIYYNMITEKKKILDLIPQDKKNNWKSLLDSIRFTGTAIDINRDNIKFNTYMFHNNNMAQIGKDFFSLESQNFKTTEFFPEKSAAVMILGDPSQVLLIASSLFNDLSGFKEKFGKYLKISSEDIYSSLIDEIGLSFIPGNGKPQERTTVAFKVKSGTAVYKTLSKAENLLSLVAEKEKFRDITVTSFRKMSFWKMDDFFLLSSGSNKEYIKSIIDTFYQDEESIKDIMDEELPDKSAGIIYLNVYKLYSNYSNIIKDEEIRNKFNKFFKGYPEIYGNINTTKEGYIFTCLMPF